MKEATITSSQLFDVQKEKQRNLQLKSLKTKRKEERVGKGRFPSPQATTKTSNN